MMKPELGLHLNWGYELTATSLALCTPSSPASEPHRAPSAVVTIK